jgi:hypothetical protein
VDDVDHNLECSLLTETEQAKLKNKEWLIKLTSAMERSFINFHGPALDNFNRSEGVNQKLSEIIVKKHQCDLAIAKMFVKTRLSMRLRDHNMPIRNASLNCTNKSYSKYYS